MSSKPVLFSGEMVRAILDGRKTQTRRIIKPQPADDEGNVWVGRILGPEMYEPEAYDRYGEAYPGKPIYGIYDEYGEWGIKCPYTPDDTLWVRETWATPGNYDHIKPSLLGEAMPRWASRITLRVTAVRVERVQDISHEDALAEGSAPDAPYNNYGTGSKYRDTFAQLWDLINEKRGYGWNDNPWVWVIEFVMEAS